jgi:tripartite-type tricarboxylate transporter receptor subunit TctC
MPNVPTFAEAGLAGFEANSWWAILAPAGTPKEIVARMQREIEKIVNLPEIQERLSASGAEPVASTPEQFGAIVRADMAKWARVIREAGIQQE